MLENFLSSIEVIFSIFRHHFRRTSIRNLQDLSFNVYLVLLKVKPAYLLDVNPFAGIRDPEAKLAKMGDICNEISRKLDTLEVRAMIIKNTDILIFNFDELTANLLSYEENKIAIVDISHTLKEPRILSGKSILKSILEMTTSVHEQITKNKERFCHEIETEDFWNITTLFGILLDYPVVLYYSDTINCDNCLGHVDLFCHKVFLNCNEKNLVFSFSCPVSLNDQTSIESWRKDLEDKWKTLDLSWETAVVNLDVVLL